MPITMRSNDDYDVGVTGGLWVVSAVGQGCPSGLSPSRRALTSSQDTDDVILNRALDG